MHPQGNRVLNDRISINFHQTLGKGSSANVHPGFSLMPQPHPIAIKAIPLKQINNEVTAYLLQCQIHSLKICSKVRNYSIVKLQQIIMKDQYCYLAMELLNGGTLKEYISERKKLKQEEALIILSRMLEGYKIMKDHGIVHRDLKPDNLMFEDNPCVNFHPPKIIDFGYCKVQSINPKPKMFYNVGSPRYMSPQAYQENLYTQKSDIWSIGITFYQMVTGTTFDKGKNILETFSFIKSKGIPIPSFLGAKTRKLLQGMLMFSHAKRMTCQQLLFQLSNPQEIQLNQSIIFNQSSAKNLSHSVPSLINDRHQSLMKSARIQNEQLKKVSPMKENNILQKSKQIIAINPSPNKGLNNCSSERNLKEVQLARSFHLPKKVLFNPRSTMMQKPNKNIISFSLSQAARNDKNITKPVSIYITPYNHKKDQYINESMPLATPKKVIVQHCQVSNQSQRLQHEQKYRKAQNIMMKPILIMKKPVPSRQVIVEQKTLKNPRVFFEVKQ